MLAGLPISTNTELVLCMLTCVAEQRAYNFVRVVAVFYYLQIRLIFALRLSIKGCALIHDTVVHTKPLQNPRQSRGVIVSTANVQLLCKTYCPPGA